MATLGLGIFTLTTTEVVPIGLLKPMATDLGVSEGLIGLTVTLLAFVAAVAALSLSAATRRIDRRLVLVCVMAVMIVGNVVTALAPSYTVLVIARIIIGCALGQMWAIVVPTAVQLVSAPHAVRATTIALSGGALASVIGLPLGTFIGQRFGWQASFWALAALAAVELLALLLFMRSTPSYSEASLRTLPGLLRWRDLRVTLILTGLAVTGSFAAYTYVTPLMVDVIGVDDDLISTVLLAMGVAGVIGSFAAGALLGRVSSPRRSMALLLGAPAIALVVVLATRSVPAASISALVVWSVGYAAVPIGLQTTVLRVAPDYRESATTLYSTMFNLSIGVGALVGAFAIDRFGAAAPATLGAVVLVTALLCTALLPKRTHA